MKIDIDQLTESELIELNQKIVQRLRIIGQMRAHVRMLDFKIGERVWFQSEREEIIRGVLVMYNSKSVTVVTNSGQRWTVSPGFLRRTTSDSPTRETTNVFEIENARSGSRK